MISINIKSYLYLLCILQFELRSTYTFPVTVIITPQSTPKIYIVKCRSH